MPGLTARSARAQPNGRRAGCTGSSRVARSIPAPGTSTATCAAVLGSPSATTARPREALLPGLSFAAAPVLQVSIVLLGATLSLGQVAEVGSGSLPVMLGTLAVALGGAWVVGRLLGVRGDAQLLIGVGTAICGASAIAATQSVIRARRSEVAYAVGTIFVFNIVAVLTFPQLGHLLGLDPQAFGLWAGTAINDTSSVVAAGYSYGGDAGPYSVVVKLTRSLMLIPIVLGLAVWAARRGAPDTTDGPAAGGRGRAARIPWTRIVPWFLVGFLAASALTSIGVVPSSWHPALTATGTFLITTALVAIGMFARPAEMRSAGMRPLLLGAVLWVLVGASSLGLQWVTGTL